KEFAVVGKNQFLIEIFLKSFITPSLPCTTTPGAKHFAADHGILHRKQVHALNGSSGTLIVKIEFANRIDGVAEEFNANGIAHQRRKNIHNSATNRKLAWGTNGLLSQVTCICQMFGKKFLRKIVTRYDLKAVSVELTGRGQSSGH